MTVPIARGDPEATEGGGAPTVEEGAPATIGPPAITGGATVTTAAGRVAIAIAVGAQAPAGRGAGAAVGGVTAGVVVAGVVTIDTAGAAVRVGTGGVIVTTVKDTGGPAGVGIGVTPDDTKLSINSIVTSFRLPPKFNWFPCFRTTTNHFGSDVTECLFPC